MENTTNIVKAILAVMQEVKNIDKAMTVGSGQSAYKGVADKDVKNIVGGAMAKHGLVALPISVDPTTKVERWEQDETWNGQTTRKVKQSVFTEVKTRYLLMHESGESIEIEGIGHGVDPQDKAAGKATTYALKNALLYSFLVPTGHIDDTDATHSENIATPQVSPTKPAKQAAQPAKQPAAKTDLYPGIKDKWDSAVKYIKDFDGIVFDALDTIKKKYSLSAENEAQLLEEAKGIKTDPVEIPQDTIDAINAASSSEELTKLYNDCKDLWVSKEFIQIWTKRRNELLIPAKGKKAA